MPLFSVVVSFNNKKRAFAETLFYYPWSEYLSLKKNTHLTPKSSGSLFETLGWAWIGVGRLSVSEGSLT